MFRRPTVFILGAGASWHYGYPTGEELVRKITEKAAVLRDFLNDRITPAPKYVQRKIADTSSEGLAVGYSAAVNECANLLGRLQSSNPLVIDYFLGHNEHLSDIGRFLIAWVILERESEFERPGRINPNRTRDEIAKGGHHKDDWYRFILHKLTSDLQASNELLSNDVTFVTFNYDVSLDSYLYRALRSLQILAQGDVDNFLSSDRIIHIYGSVRATPVRDIQSIDFRSVSSNRTAPQVGRQNQLKATSVLDEAYVAGQNLRVIDPHDKGANDELLQCARAAIARAEVVYILGYGFDRNNNRRLSLYEACRDPMGHKKVILFTNMGDSNKVNMEASKIFHGEPRQLLAGCSPIPGSAGQPIWLEKSIRNVYDALAVDFDEPDQELK